MISFVYSKLCSLKQIYLSSPVKHVACIQMSVQLHQEEMQCFTTFSAEVITQLACVKPNCPVNIATSDV